MAPVIQLLQGLLPEACAGEACAGIACNTTLSTRIARQTGTYLNPENQSRGALRQTQMTDFPGFKMYPRGGKLVHLETQETS